MAVLLGGAVLTSCTVGPNYKRPQIAVPDQFRNANGAAAPASLADQKWFDLFQDDALKQLISTALEHNFDMRIAAERILEARAQVGIVRSGQLPAVDANAQFNANTNSAIGANILTPGIRSASYTTISTNVSWDLDLWGKLRRLTEAARAQYAASEEGRRALTVSLIGDVMNAYFGLLEQDLELSITNETRAAAEDGLRLTRLRRERGAATGLDVAQAEQLLYTATAQIASIQRSIGLYEDQLSLLAGDAPHAIARVTKLEQIPLPPELPAGLPADLLTRRPDIRQVEQGLVAANAQLGAARALLLPDISLTALLGTQSRALSTLFSGASRQSALTPAAYLPIFRAGIRSGIQLTEAQQREALVTYQKAIYSALREVSDALVDHDQQRAQRLEQEKLVTALNTTVNLANLRYRGGLDSYLQVLDAQRNLFQGQLNLARLRLDEVLAIVELYRALGGGWQA